MSLNPRANENGLSSWKKSMTHRTSQQSQQAAGHENYCVFLRVGFMSGESLFCWLQSERNSLNISSASSLKIQRNEKGNQILTAFSCTSPSISWPPPSQNIILSLFLSFQWHSFTPSIFLCLSHALSLLVWLTCLQQACLWCRKGLPGGSC